MDDDSAGVQGRRGNKRDKKKEIKYTRCYIICSITAY